MQTTAQLNNLRIAPRKIRLVAQVIRGMNVDRAQGQLDFLAKKSAKHLSKLLKSAIANAENNLGQDRGNLFVKDLIVNEGMKIKRFMPRAMGRAGMIQKKTSHIKIILEEKIHGLKVKKSETVVAKQETNAEPKTIREKQRKPSVEAKKEISKKGAFGNVKNIGRRLFRRKAV